MTTTEVNAEPTTVHVRWIDTSQELLMESLLAEAMNPELGGTLKERALARLGIQAQPGEHPLTAWLRVMAEENNLPHTTPCHPALSDAAMSGSVGRWVFWLA
jgi:hypothetical protein